MIRTLTTLAAAAALAVSAGAASAGAAKDGTSNTVQSRTVAAKTSPTRGTAAYMLTNTMVSGIIMRDGGPCDPIRHMGC